MLVGTVCLHVCGLWHAALQCALVVVAPTAYRTLRCVDL